MTIISTDCSSIPLHEGLGGTKPNVGAIDSYWFAAQTVNGLQPEPSLYCWSVHSVDSQVNVAICATVQPALPVTGLSDDISPEGHVLVHTKSVCVSSNARGPMSYTPFPMITEVRLEQSLNASSANVNKLSGMVIDVRPVFRNALAPIEITPSSSIDVRPESMKA